MQKTRSFNIVLVKENHGNGLPVVAKPDRIVTYTGEEQVIKF
jgi:hypothetical protein